MHRQTDRRVNVTNTAGTFLQKAVMEMWGGIEKERVS